MRIKSLKYGFLSTYRYTVFVRRAATYRWELSMPIRENSMNLSVREYIAGLCVLAVNDRTFDEPDDFQRIAGEKQNFNLCT